MLKVEDSNYYGILPIMQVTLTRASRYSYISCMTYHVSYYIIAKLMFNKLDSMGADLYSNINDRLYDETTKNS